MGLGVQDPDPLKRGVPMIRPGEGIVVLGAPIGYQGFVKEKMMEKVEKVRSITEKLPLLRDPHLEFVLLRSCLSLPKVMFLLRALDTTEHQDVLEAFDSIIRGALSRLLGTPVSDHQWSQAKLPVAMGGLGLRSAVDHAPSAFAVSLLAAQSLINDILGRGESEEPFNLPAFLLETISEKQGEETVLVTESLVGVTQKMASLKVDKHNQTSLLTHFREAGVTREIARMASLGLPHAGNWLSVVPLSALGLHLRSNEFLPLLKYRLGIPIYRSEGPCPACKLPSDSMGDHALGCAKTGDRIARHNMLRDVLFEAAASAALGPSKEEPHLLPGSQARPGDILIRRWSDGKDAAIDVTVTSPLASTNVTRAAAEPGSSLTKAFDRKRRETAEACQQQGLVFFPVALETLGGFHSVAIGQVKQVGAALARQTGSDEREVTSQLFQRLSLQLMRGNAALLSARSPDGDVLTPEVDGSE